MTTSVFFCHSDSQRPKFRLSVLLKLLFLLTYIDYLKCFGFKIHHIIDLIIIII